MFLYRTNLCHADGKVLNDSHLRNDSFNKWMILISLLKIMSEQKRIKDLIISLIAPFRSGQQTLVSDLQDYTWNKKNVLTYQNCRTN